MLSTDITTELRELVLGARTRAPLIAAWLQIRIDHEADTDLFAPPPYEHTGGPPIGDDLPATEAEAVERLLPFLHPEGLVCACGHDSFRRRADRPRVRICRRCRASTSVTSGTLLHGQRDLCRLFAALAWMLEHARPTKHFARFYGCNPKTAYATMQRIRLVLERPPTRLGPTTSGTYLARGLAQPAQPERESPTRWGRHLLPRHAVPGVVWCDDEDVVCFPTVADSHALAPAMVPEGVSPDIGAHAPLARPSRPPTDIRPRDWQVRMFISGALFFTHRRVSTNWLPRYLDAFAWMVRQRSRGASRADQLSAILTAFGARPQTTIRQLAPARR